MASEKEQLREKLIGFQRHIADLKRELASQEQGFRDREARFLSGFFEVMDAFETLEANLESKAKDRPPDKPERMLRKNIRSIYKKMYRTFRSNRIEQIRFEDGKANMAQCKILDTRPDPELPEASLVEIVKNGYMDTHDDTVLRKAEVITVRNQ